MFCADFSVPVQLLWEYCMPPHTVFSSVPLPCTNKLTLTFPTPVLFWHHYHVTTSMTALLQCDTQTIGGVFLPIIL